MKVAETGNQEGHRNDEEHAVVVVGYPGGHVLSSL